MAKKTKNKAAKKTKKKAVKRAPARKTKKSAKKSMKKSKPAPAAIGSTSTGFGSLFSFGRSNGGKK